MAITQVTTTINGETAYIAIPDNWQPGGRAIIQGHGSGGHSSFSMTDGTTYPTNGFIQAFSNTHNDSWGNAQSNSDIEALRQWLVANYNINPKIILMGFSMAGATCLNYATHYPNNVDRIVLDSGTANVRNPCSGDISADITAYGVSNISQIPSEYSPVLNFSNLATIPMVFWTGDADATVPFGQNTRLVAEKVGRIGGKVLYMETHGGGHQQYHTISMMLDILKAPVIAVNPNKTGNLIDGTQTSLTQFVVLAPRTNYIITTTAPNILSYCLDGASGAYTAITGTSATITTVNRRMMILLKVTNSSYNFSNVSIIRK